MERLVPDTLYWKQRRVEVIAFMNFCRLFFFFFFFLISGQPKAPPLPQLRSPRLAAAVVHMGFGAHHR